MKLLVGLIVGLAAVFVGIRLWKFIARAKAVHRGEASPGCSCGCDSCSEAPKPSDDSPSQG